MARDIDERVVSMAFENEKFEAGVAQTMATLRKLNDALKVTGTASGLGNIEAEANKVKLTGISAAVDNLKSKFAGLKDKMMFPGAEKAFNGISTAASKVNLSPLQTAFEKAKGWLNFGRAPQQAMADIEAASRTVNLGGINNAISETSRGFSVLQGAAAVALGGIAAIAVQQGSVIAKALTIGPVMDGFREYETNLTSIQTILANTQADGTKLKDVTKALDELNVYSDKTIYNFGEMARNIGTFTAAGVDLKTATSSIKGIANLAALSGSNSQQASTAMYQLSQAIAAGKVNLMDWNSVVNAGMGGEVFQKALWDTAKAMGTIKNIPMGETFEEWKKKGNTFRQSLSQVQKDAASGLTALRKAQEEGSKSIQHAQESAAEATEQAARRVKDAQQGVSQANKQAALDVKEAIAAQHAAVKQSAEDVKNALEGVRDARKRLAEAMKPPSQNELEAANDNLKTAQLDQADLAGAVSEAQQEQSRSAQDLADAQQRLSDLQRSGAGAADLLSAQRAVEDAQKRATDASDAQERALLRQRAAARGVTEAEQALAETQKKGTEQDQNVKDARDALTQATTAYKDAQVKAAKDVEAAEKHTADVRVKSVAAQKAAGQQLADAEKQQAKTIRDSRESVASATEAAAERIQQAKLAMAEKGPDMTWLTSDVLTKTLKQFTGDMTDAQLAAMGFNKEQIKSIQTQAKTAVHAAQDVKTLTALISTTKEQLGTGFSNTFKTLFGDFETAPEMFTSLSKSIGGFVSAQSDARNKLLKDWAALGGRDLLGQGLKNAFDGLLSVLKPVKEAFREIFPKKTAEDLVELSAKFAAFTEKLKIGPETANDLKRTFAGLFAVLSIGKSILSGVVTVFKQMLKPLMDGSGGVLEFTGSIGDFLVSLDKAIKKSEGFRNFFVTLGNVLAVPIKLLARVIELIGDLFGGEGAGSPNMEGPTKAVTGFTKVLQPLSDVLDKVSELWGTFLEKLGSGQGIIGQIGNVFKEAIGGITDAFQSADYSKVFQILQTTLIGGIFLTIRKALKGGLKLDLGGGVVDSIKDTLGGLTGSLKSMQNTLKSATLLAIASALAILSVAVLGLAQVDPKRLASSMTAISVGLGQLVGAMALLGKVGGTGAFIQLPIMATGLVAVAAAVDVLVIAIRSLSGLDWEELAKGLSGVAGALTAVGIGVKLIPPSIVVVGPALIAVSIGLNAIAVAMKIFATMKWEEMGKGLVGIAGGLTAIAIGMGGMPVVRLTAAAAGIVVLSAGLIVLAGAIKLMGSMDVETMAKGIGGFAAALVTLGLALAFIPPTLPIQAAGLVILAGALVGVATAVALMGGLQIGTMAKGIAGLGAALVVLGVGLTALQAGLPGAAALTLAAAGLAVLVPVLGILGTMKLGTILKGLAAIAGVMLTIGLAGNIAAPGLMAVGIAMNVLGAAMILAGTGVYLMAKGISLLSNDGQKGVAALMLALTGLAAIFPKIVIDFLQGLVQIADSVAQVAPKVVRAFGVILDQILMLITRLAPHAAIAFGSLVDAMAQAVFQKSGLLIETGWTLLLNFLRGVSEHIGETVGTVALIVTTFLTELAGKLPDIIAAGADVMVAYLRGLADEYPRVIAEAGTLIATLITAIAEQLPKIITAGARIITNFLLGIAQNIEKVATAGGTLIIKIIQGISDQNRRVLRAAAKFVGDFLEEAAKQMVQLADRIAKIIINFLHGIEKAIRDNDDDIRAAGWGVADAIIDGMWEGIHELGQKIVDKLGMLIHLLPKAARKILGIKSPSTVFKTIGGQTMDGLALGISSNTSPVRSIVDKGGEMKDAMQDTMSDIPSQLDGEMDMNPVITPVLDFSEIKKQMASGENPMGYMINDARLQGPLNVRGLSYVRRTAEEMAAFDAARQASRVAQDVRDAEGGMGRPIMFKQYNTSPKALSASEIYRHTKTGLALVKGHLVSAQWQGVVRDSG